MKHIYEQMARQHQTTPAEVQREIEATIEQMWQDAQGNPQRLAQLQAISATGAKPTAAELILHFVRQAEQPPK